MPGAPTPPNERERLAALRRSRLLDTLPERAFDDLALMASAICGTPIGLVSLVDVHRQWFKARVGLEAQETSREESFCAYALLESQVFEVTDATADPRFSDNPLVTGPMQLRFYAGVPLTDPDGYALGAVCALDMRPRALTPEQKRALEALARQAADVLRQRATSRALEQARWQLEDLLGQAHQLVQIVREDGGFRFVNQSWRQTLGYSEAELASLRFADIVAPEDRARVPELLGAAGSGKREVELRLVTRSGAALMVEAHFSRREGDGEDGALTLALMRDVTELREVENLKRDFVATVSHELRTPLTSIRGALGLIRGGIAGVLPDEARGLVDIAHGNAERLIRLVNDILDMEKLDAGRVELALRDVEPAELVRTTVEAISGMAHELGVPVETDVRPGPPVRVDPERLVQVLCNLVSNALKFSPAGAPVRLEVGPGAAGSVRFAVRDRGAGIPEDRQKLLFQRFRQLESPDTRKRAGTGLGLAITRALVEQHGGRIGVESAPGAGSTFWVELPASASGPGTQPEPRVPGTRRPGAALALVVDDDASLRAVVAAQLRGLGVDCVQAGSGEEALELAREVRPDLLILDVRMPTLDGFKTVEALRLGPLRHLPTLIYTVHEPGPGEREALRLGVTRFLTKSRASEEELLSAVRSLLGEQLPGGATDA